MSKDDLAHARQARKLRDDLRALKAQYPELTTPAAQRRLEDYLEAEIAKENTMPRPGDRMLGEDLTIVTFRIPKSALPLIETHLIRMQQASRWVKLGKSDAQRDIFLRGLDEVEQLPEPVRPRQVEMALPGEPAATSAGGAIPPAPAYEARVLTPEVEPELPLEHPLEHELDDTPMELAVDVTQESVVPAAPREEPDWSQGSTWREAFDANPLTPPDVTQENTVPAAPAETVTPSRSRKAARSKAAPPGELEPEASAYEVEVLTPAAFPAPPAEETRANAEAARPKAAAKKRTARTTKGRRQTYAEKDPKDHQTRVPT